MMDISNVIHPGGSSPPEPSFKTAKLPWFAEIMEIRNERRRHSIYRNDGCDIARQGLGAETPQSGSSSSRGSPTPAFSFPVRRKLSPKPPRAMSLSHAQTSHHLETHPPPLPSMSPAKHIPVQSQFPPGMQPSRSSLNTKSSSEGAGPWSKMMRRHDMEGAMTSAEGQQAFLALPGLETLVYVEVDYSQASKKADEKRQRSVVASTRHRRKKIMQEENTKQLQELRDERRRLEIKLKELTHQRDFYRDDRNRLRDIMSQTPGISHPDAGPSSPASARSSSYAERSSLMAAPHAMPSQGPPSEPSPGERPAQRRRTDDRPDFPMPMYIIPGGVHPGASPGALPPMQAQ